MVSLLLVLFLYMGEWCEQERLLTHKLIIRYLLAVIMFDDVGFEFPLPVVDLSTRFKGRSDREAANRE